eukprot:366012-Chlamydomonas_euryale.AAC.17
MGTRSHAQLAGCHKSLQSAAARTKSLRGCATGRNLAGLCKAGIWQCVRVAATQATTRHQQRPVCCPAAALIGRCC